MKAAGSWSSVPSTLTGRTPAMNFLRLMPSTPVWAIWLLWFAKAGPLLRRRPGVRARRSILQLLVSSIQSMTTRDATLGGSRKASQPMRKDERDTVRQVLEAALKNLSDEFDGEATSESIALFGDPCPSSESRGFEVPIVLIVTGDLKACSQNTALAKPARVDDTKE